MELFRKEAVESFSSSAKLNAGVRAIYIKTAVFLVLLLLCAAAFGYWLMCGTIYETVTVSGAVWPMRNGGTVYATCGGVVSKTVVSEGDVVKAGDILLMIPQNDVLAELEAAKQAGVPRMNWRRYIKNMTTSPWSGPQSTGPLHTSRTRTATYRKETWWRRWCPMTRTETTAR